MIDMRRRREKKNTLKLRVSVLQVNANIARVNCYVCVVCVVCGLPQFNANARDTQTFAHLKGTKIQVRAPYFLTCPSKKESKQESKQKSAFDSAKHKWRSKFN